jgi:hypothetical protein
MMLATVFLGAEPGDGDPEPFLAVLLLIGCGVAGLFVCFCCSVPILASQQELREHESHH